VETIDELEKFKAERISLLNTLQIVAEITNDLVRIVFLDRESLNIYFLSIYRLHSMKLL